MVCVFSFSIEKKYGKIYIIKIIVNHCLCFVYGLLFNKLGYGTSGYMRQALGQYYSRLIIIILLPKALTQTYRHAVIIKS